MLELYNVRMKSLNVKKNKGTTKCDKRTVTSNVGTAQYEDGTVKYKKKNKETIKCDKRIITCDVGTA